MRREEVAAFVLGTLLRDSRSEEAREIRGELVSELKDDEPLLRALVRHTQTMRDVGALNDDEAHHLIGLFTERFSVHYAETDPELLDLESRLRVIEAEHGLDEGSGDFMLSETPPQWLALSKAWDRSLDHLWSALLRDLGEPEMAAILTLPVHQERWAAGLRSPNLRASGSEEDGALDW